MKRKLLLMILLLIFIFGGKGNLFSQNACKPLPPNNSGHPGGDNPDDNFSYNSDDSTKIFYITPAIIVYRKGYYKTWIKDENSFGRPNNAITDLKDVWKELLKSGNSLILPTGSLFSEQNNLSLRETLKNYVQNGGTIIVFAQQYGRQVEDIIPVPEGESLKVYGWREDQSCYLGSVYSSITNPIVSSLGNLGYRIWDIGFSMYEAESKTSSKSHGFFIKRACSFLVEDKLFNQKKYYYLRRSE